MNVLRPTSIKRPSFRSAARSVAGLARKRDSPDHSSQPNSADCSREKNNPDHASHSEVAECDNRNDNAGTTCHPKPVNNTLSPLLPQELWGEVFKHATNTHPQPMTIHDFTHAGCIDSPRLTCLELQRRLHHLSMKTKTALTLVCRSWHPLAKPILFESVRITDIRQLESLLLLLESEQRAGKIGPASSAWWIRELWFDTTICTCARPDEPNALAKLLKLCPRVMAFRKFGRSNCSADDIREVNVVLEPLICQANHSKDDESHSKGTTLTHLDLAFSNMWSFEHFLSANPELGNEVPSVRYMELRPSYISMIDDPDSESPYVKQIPPTFPSLVSLRLLGSLSMIQATRFSLPALRSLTVYSTAFDRTGDYHSISAVLQAHGGNLVELELDVPLSCLPNLSVTCPKLRRLQIPATAFVGAELPNIDHQTVTTLGIFGMQKLVYEQKHRTFTPRLLEALEKHFSGVKEVQDVSLKSHDLRQRSVALWTAQDALDHRSFWSSLTAFLKARDVKLTDWSGYPIAGFESRRDSMIMASEADEISEGLMCCH
ncbi:hypothetical protein M407DRAFT_10438 [Tulasnella calospora MUT 4182]|uniref:F-box domain-containing protein n=1 Tax=Tulasnella calospora MUT 4182 TaxID=1051891 RepID=A0A0C3LJ12_9AGAM|nr:hypothetical protein M407DRAFT_10438 [Tulasnella calospora MUT 4182]